MKHDWQEYEERGKAWAVCQRCGRVGPPAFVRSLAPEPDDCRATTEPEASDE